VAVSTRKHIDGTLQDGYGYQWWIAAPDLYMALGYRGQYIVVVPEQDLAVVFASGLAERDFYVPQRLLTEYILPAVHSDTALPENSEGSALMKSYLNDLAARH
jgi:CubicO group peptidase (beta-lactamase class C family)